MKAVIHLNLHDLLEDTTYESDPEDGPDEIEKLNKITNELFHRGEIDIVIDTKTGKASIKEPLSKEVGDNGWRKF